MNKLIFIYLFIFSLSCFSQRETDNWFFGDKAGIVFNPDNISISNKGQIVTEPGSSSISSNQGDLLFYTNGATIWNKNHKVMENGEDLIGEAETAQPSIIIPKPKPSKAIIITYTGNNQSVGPTEISLPIKT